MPVFCGHWNFCLNPVNSDTKLWNWNASNNINWLLKPTVAKPSLWRTGLTSSEKCVCHGATGNCLTLRGEETVLARLVCRCCAVFGLCRRVICLGWERCDRFGPLFFLKEVKSSPGQYSWCYVVIKGWRAIEDTELWWINEKITRHSPVQFHYSVCIQAANQKRADTWTRIANIHQVPLARKYSTSKDSS